MAYCSFCNNEVLKGTGEIYVLKDGTALNFCGSKCKRNSQKLKREGRLMKWTSKTLVLSSDRKAPEKKESALSQDIAAKLAEKKSAAAKK